MIKRVLFSFLLMATVFACAGMASVTQYRLKFKVNTPFMLESTSAVALPPGEYWVKDMGTGPGHLFSLERGDNHRHLAWLNTVRIDRALVSWTDKPTVSFDYESSLPVIKELYLPATDGYEILSAKYDKKSKYFVDVASLTKTKYTITEQKVETTSVEEAPAKVEEAPPAAEPEPAPVEEPKVEQQEEPQPVQPIEPIKERIRVRKD